MATAAFKSTTKRSSLGGGATDHSTSTPTSTSSSSARRRARSVSRFSHRPPQELDTDFVESTPRPARTRGKFVNTVRGSAFPDISLDDLAIELFSSGGGGRSMEFSNDRGRTSSDEVSGSSRRGRSVSRLSSKAGTQQTSMTSGRVGMDGGCDRRRRSLSVARYRGCDSESDGDSENLRSHNNAKTYVGGSKPSATVHKPNPPRGLRRCSSQRDILRSHDGYSSHSSALTDDESKDAPLGSDYLKNTCSSYLRNKEILKKNPSDFTKGGSMLSKSLDVHQASAVRSYSSEMEQSERRKQELLKEIILEEQRGKELRRITKVLPESNRASSFKRPSRPRRRSNDRRQISKQIDDDAEKIIEDFISSVEDNTDISSFDGERSDTSSTFGVTVKFRDNLMHCGEIESQRTAPAPAPVPVEMDGVVLPWLQWDASNESSFPSKVRSQIPATPKTVLQDALEEMNAVHELEQSSRSNSSRGSWSPAVMDGFSIDSEVSSTKMLRMSIKGMNQNLSSVLKRRSRVINMDDYMKSKGNEEFILERWNQRERISSGGMLLCGSSIDGMFLL